jgi:predicted permease
VRVVDDVRDAGRQLLRAPVFGTSAILTLALAAGLGALVLTIVNALLFRPLPVRSPDELVRIYSTVPGELMSHSPMSAADYEDLREQCGSFSGIASSFLTMAALQENGAVGHIALTDVVSLDYFALLGVEPARGRLFGPGDAEGEAASLNPWGGAPVAVLSHAAWVRRFGADPSVVGHRVRLNGRVVAVVGVAPPSFFGLDRGVSPELWLPSRAPTTASAEDRRTRSLWLIARLRPGASLAGAREEVAAVSRRLQSAHPETNRNRQILVVRSETVRVLPDVDQPVRAGSLAGLGVVALVLLVACSNVAHLLLVRALRRRREIGTRLALGASRAALVRPLLAEGLLLSFAGSTLGLAVAAGAHRLVARLVGPLPVDVAFGLAVDWRVVLATVGASALAILALTIGPALVATRVDVARALWPPGVGGGAGTRPVRRALLASQLAVSFLLVASALLAIRSARSLAGLDLGFRPQGAVVASFAPRLQGYDIRSTGALYADLLESIRARPDTIAAGLASHLPLTIEVAYDHVAPVGTDLPAERWPAADSALVGPGYFAAMGTRILRGRPFDARDRADAPPVVVVNQTLARRLWPGAEAVGRRLRIDGVPGEPEVVGVAADGRYRSLGETPRPFLFRAFAQGWAGRTAHAGEIALGSQTVVVRTRSSPAVALATLRELARRTDERLAVVRLSTLAAATRLPFLLPRVVAVLFAVFAAIALGLAAVGVFGMTACSAGSRTREIGVRLALGAQKRDVVGLLMRESALVLAAGVALGSVAGTVAAHGLSALLGAIHAPDAATFALAALLLAVVAGVSSLLPARRASRTEPQAALRSE